jgi:hypothetical protein
MLAVASFTRHLAFGFVVGAVFCFVTPDEGGVRWGNPFLGSQLWKLELAPLNRLFWCER